MAVTITRVTWDDGAAGTLIDNAEKNSAIYDKIDELLDGTKDLVIGGLVGSEKLGTHQWSGSGAGANIISNRNSTAGATNRSVLELGTDAAAIVASLEALSSSFSSTGAQQANGVALRGLLAGGVRIYAEHASGTVVLGAAGTTKIATFNGDRVALTGGAPGSYALGGTLKDSVNISQQGTPGNTLKTTLHSFSLPADTLKTNGERIRITAFGTFASNANSKNIGIDFGAQVLADVDLPQDGNTQDWKMVADVVRTGAATQKANIELSAANTATPNPGQNRYITQFTSPTETLSGAITIAIHGTNGTASANDIVCEVSWVELHPVV